MLINTSSDSGRAVNFLAGEAAPRLLDLSPAYEFHPQFGRSPISRDNYAVSVESGIAGCQLTAAIPEEKSSSCENAARLPNVAQVKDAERVPD